MTRTIVGLFDDYSDAQDAMNDLMAAGFRREDISMVANNTGERFAVGERAKTGEGHDTATGIVGGAAEGGIIGGLTGLAAGLAMMLLPGIGPVLAIGPLAAALSGAGLGAVGGGIIGGLTGAGISEEEASYYAEGVRRGGTLLTVHADDARADDARTIIDRHDAHKIHELGSYYRSTGFTGYSENDPHWTTDQINEDRTRYSTYRQGRATEHALDGSDEENLRSNEPVSAGRADAERYLSV